MKKFDNDWGVEFLIDGVMGWVEIAYFINSSFADEYLLYKRENNPLGEYRLCWKGMEVRDCCLD